MLGYIVNRLALILGSHRCECQSGWANSLNDPQLPCDVRQCVGGLTCQHGGICVPESGNVPEHCDCEPGFGGDQCERQ